MTADRLNTLVVDDESSFRRVLRTSLATSGFAIEEARSGEEAVAMLVHSAFDLVKALEAGADDYVTKPIRFRELVARLRAVIRRLRIDDAGEPTLLQAGD